MLKEREKRRTQEMRKQKVREGSEVDGIPAV